MKIRVENTYSDGHASTLEYEISDDEVPDQEQEGDGYDTALEDLLFEYTGDGHGMDNNLYMIADVTITEAADETLVDTTYEYGG